MKLSKRQTECLERINSEWVSIWDLPKPTINLNTVYSLLHKGLIEIKWVGDSQDRKPFIRKKGLECY